MLFGRLVPSACTRQLVMQLTIGVIVCVITCCRVCGGFTSCACGVVCDRIVTSAPLVVMVAIDGGDLPIAANHSRFYSVCCVLRRSG